VDIELHLAIELSLKNEDTMQWFLTQSPPKFSRCPTPKKFIIAAIEKTIASLARIKAIKQHEQDAQKAKMDKQTDRTFLTAGIIKITYRDLKGYYPHPCSTSGGPPGRHGNNFYLIYSIQYWDNISLIIFFLNIIKIALLGTEENHYIYRYLDTQFMVECIVQNISLLL
jgi:hypothetical protein